MTRLVAASIAALLTLYAAQVPTPASHISRFRPARIRTTSRPRLMAPSGIRRSIRPRSVSSIRRPARSSRSSSARKRPRMA